MKKTIDVHISENFYDEEGEFSVGEAIAIVDCSHWSADRFRQLWEFLHQEAPQSADTFGGVAHG